MRREELLDKEPPAPVWGPPPTHAELQRARATGDAAVREGLGEATTGALTREAAAHKLGTTPSRIADEVKAGRLLELPGDPQRRLPAWQFDGDRPLPGLERLIGAWPGTPLSLSTWATRPNVDLDGRAPAEELARRGAVDRVLEVARSLSAAAW